MRRMVVTTLPSAYGPGGDPLDAWPPIPQEPAADPDPFPRARLPQDPWRALYPLPVCPDCGTYVHDETLHRKYHLDHD